MKKILNEENLGEMFRVTSDGYFIGIFVGYKNNYYIFIEIGTPAHQVWLKKKDIEKLETYKKIEKIETKLFYNKPLNKLK